MSFSKITNFTSTETGVGPITHQNETVGATILIAGEQVRLISYYFGIKSSGRRMFQPTSFGIVAEAQTTIEEQSLRKLAHALDRDFRTAIDSLNPILKEAADTLRRRDPDLRARLMDHAITTREPLWRYLSETAPGSEQRHHRLQALDAVPALSVILEDTPHRFACKINRLEAGASLKQAIADHNIAWSIAKHLDPWSGGLLRLHRAVLSPPEGPLSRPQLGQHFPDKIPAQRDFLTGLALLGYSHAPAEMVTDQLVQWIARTATEAHNRKSPHMRTITDWITADLTGDEHAPKWSSNLDYEGALTRARQWITKTERARSPTGIVWDRPAYAPQDHHTAKSALTFIDNADDLITVAEALDNCAHTYIGQARSGRSALYLLTISGKPVAMLEIVGTFDGPAVIQARGRFNTPLTDHQTQRLKTWLRPQGVAFTNLA